MVKHFYHTSLGLCLALFLSLDSPKAATPEQVELAINHKIVYPWVLYPLGTYIAGKVKILQELDNRTFQQQYEEMVRALIGEIRTTCVGKYKEEIGKQRIEIFDDNDFRRCALPQQRFFKRIFEREAGQFLSDYERDHGRKPSLEEHLAYLKSSAEDLARRHAAGECPGAPPRQQAVQAEDSTPAFPPEEGEQLLLHLLDTLDFIEQPFGEHLAARGNLLKSTPYGTFNNHYRVMAEGLNYEVLNTCLVQYKTEIGKQGVELYADPRFRRLYFPQKRAVEKIFVQEAREREFYEEESQIRKAFKETHGSDPSLDEHLALLHSLVEDLARRQAAGEFTAAAPQGQQAAAPQNNNLKGKPLNPLLLTSS